MDDAGNISELESLKIANRILREDIKLCTRYIRTRLDGSQPIDRIFFEKFAQTQDLVIEESEKIQDIWRLLVSIENGVRPFLNHLFAVGITDEMRDETELLREDLVAYNEIVYGHIDGIGWIKK